MCIIYQTGKKLGLNRYSKLYILQTLDLHIANVIQ